MSTPNSPVFVKYRGGNNAVDFSVPFPYFDRSYVKLIYKALNSDEVELVVNTDYIWKDDHTVTLSTPLGEYDVLVIVRRTDLGSPAEFDNQRRLFPVAAMDNDDLSFHQIQELQEQLNRCYKEDITSGKDGSDIESIVDNLKTEMIELKDYCGVYADLSQQWAIKTDGPVADNEYSSRYYANQIIPLSSYIVTVSGISSDVTTVAGISSNVTTVATISSDVSAVANNATDISAVADELTSIAAVAADLTNIDAASGYADLAKDWAIKTDGMVDSTDYSSKYYANLSKQWATSTTVIESGKYGASYYALQAYNANVSAQNAKSEAKDWANKTDGAVSGGEYSAKYYTGHSKVWAEGTDVEVQALGGIHSAKGWASSLGNVYKPAGSVAFASLPTLGSAYLGFVYNVTDSFTTTSDFVEGAGKSYPAGTNVVCIDTGSSVYKWDILGGFVDLSGYQPLLVSGTNIKTINGDSILGSGNIDTLSTKANKDLDNLTSVGKNITNWSSNVTNCVVEIPNDVKLELSNRALVVKAGSKFYIPNGSNNFDILTLNNDISYTTGGSNKLCLLCMKDDGSIISNWYLPVHHRSDSSDPSSGFYGFSYNTSDNTLYDFRGDGIRGAKCSLPFAIISEDNNSVTGIMQILNGITFCGHTLFVLPGVKALHAEGFNDDGTLKNSLVSVNKVLINTGGTSNTLSHMILRYDANDCQLASQTQTWRYWRYRNQFMYLVNGDTAWIDIGTYLIDSSYYSIIKFRPKISFSSIDYNNTNDLIFQTFPSQDALQNLTLGASGSTYVAPTNGYVHIVIDVDPNGWISVNDVYAQASNVSGYVSVYLPIASGKSFYIYYSGYRSTILFRFYQTLGDARYE